MNPAVLTSAVCERYEDVLTVDGAPYGVGLGKVADATEQLSAVTLTVLFDCVDLGHSGGWVSPEDGLAVLPACGVTSCIAAACGAHWRSTQTHTWNSFIRNWCFYE